MDKIVSPSSLSGTLAVIPSKSASHRAVILAAMARGEMEIEPLQLSEDVSATLSCCRQLGLCSGATLIDAEEPGFVRARISGSLSRPVSRAMRTLDAGESGSTLRLLLPLALDGRGPVRFLGRGRLMQRPLTVYEELFTDQGISWAQRGNELTVNGRLSGGIYSVAGDISSQFISGLLLALPRLDTDSTIQLTTPLESAPYVEMTRSIQALFGIHSAWSRDGSALHIKGNQTVRSPGSLRIEGDWSHAAFYLVAGLISQNGPVSLTCLDNQSVQADRQIVDILRDMGGEIQLDNGLVTAFPSYLHPIEVNVSQCPDLVPILAVAMAAAHGESRITGAERLRYKESDRLSAMANALNACGSICQETSDGLIIRGGFPLREASIDGCHDHRVVMAMAVASALSRGNFILSDSDSVSKSAPSFWHEFELLGGKAS